MTVDLSDLVFLDTETTGLDPDRHEVWEVGAIVGEEEHHWFLPVDLSVADVIALNIGKYHERFRAPSVSRWQFAEKFVDLTWGKHVVGAIPSFDCERLFKLIRKAGLCPGWHYHLLDIESMIAGAFKVQPPYKYTELLALLEIDESNYEKHTALGDARCVRDAYVKLMGG